jgi:hypothetical protein
MGAFMLQREVCTTELRSKFDLFDRAQSLDRFLQTFVALAVDCMARRMKKPALRRLR